MSVSATAEATFTEPSPCAEDSVRECAEREAPYGGSGWKESIVEGKAPARGRA